MAGTVEHREIYNNAAANSLAEFRRMILALKEYRTSPVRRQVTKIEQQNISHQQEVRYVAPARAGTAPTPRRWHRTCVPITSG
jgi:hypothetical protein